MTGALICRLHRGDAACLAANWAESSVYDSGRWLAVIRDGFGCDVARLDVMLGGSCIAQFPLALQRKAIFMLAGSPLRGTHSEFGGWIADGTDVAQVMKAVHAYLRNAGHAWIEFIFADPAASLEQVMQGLGYKVERKPSSLVDLDKSSEDVWKGFAGRARTEIRKAEKNGLSVRRLTSDDNEDYMRLVETVFLGQKRRASFDVSFLNAVHSHLHARECAHYGIFTDGQLVAGGLFLHYNNRMVFVSGASDHATRKLGGNSLIQWQAIKDAMAAGVTRYDMGGTGVATIDKFKISKYAHEPF